MPSERIPQPHAHKELIASFNERIESRRLHHPDESSWVIPFHYDLEDGEDFNVVGALWVPPDEVQYVTNMSTYYHMSAAVAMEGDMLRLGIDASSMRCNSEIDLSDDVPKVSIPKYMTTVALRRLQIERDFGVVIKFE